MMPGFTSVPGFVRFLHYKLKQREDIIENVGLPTHHGRSVTMNFKISGENPTNIGISKYEKKDEEGLKVEFLGGALNEREKTILDPLLQEFRQLVDNCELYKWFDKNNVPTVGMGIEWEENDFRTPQERQTRYNENKIARIFSLLAENSENEDLSDEYNKLNEDRRSQQKDEICAGEYLRNYYREKYASLDKDGKERNYRKEIYFWKELLITGKLFVAHDSKNEPQIEEVLLELMELEINRLNNEDKKNTKKESELTFKTKFPVEKAEGELKNILKNLISIKDPEAPGKPKYIENISEADFIYLFTGKPIKEIPKKLKWKDKAFCARFLDKIVSPQGLKEGIFSDYSKARKCFIFDGKPFAKNKRSNLTIEKKHDLEIILK